MDNSLKLNKNILYQILFGLCVAVTYLNKYELTFAVWVFTCLVTIKQNYSYTVLRYVALFAAIFTLALIVAFFKYHTVYNYIRDITYLVKPILGILIGYQLCKNNAIKPFHTIVYVGLFIAFIHLGIIFKSIVIYKILNIHKLREHGGYFSDFEVYSLIVLIFSNRFKLGFSAQYKWILIGIIGVSSLLYVSRTNFLQFIVLYFAMMGYLRLTKRSITVMGSLLVFVIILYSVLFSMNFNRNGSGTEAFLFKIKNAPIEAFKTKVNKDDWQDFNDNYRSYENIITTNQVTREGMVSTLFGKGMGATVNLGRKVYSNDGEFIQFVPQLHNGFMIVFLKTGLTGVFIYLMFLYYLCKVEKTNDYYIQQVNYMLFGTGVLIIMSSWVLMGLYLKTDNKSILIGFLLCYKELLVKQQQQAVVTDV